MPDTVAAAKRVRPLLSWHRPQAGGDGAGVLPLWGLCPQAEELTAYDRRHLRLYTAVLIASEDGVSLEYLAVGFFGFDLERNRDWALRVTRSHLRRAAWVQERSVPTLDLPAAPSPL